MGVEIEELRSLANQQTRDAAALIEALARACGAPGPAGPAHIVAVAAAAIRANNEIEELKALIQKQERDRDMLIAALARRHQYGNRWPDDVKNVESGMVESGVIIGPAMPFHSVQPRATQLKQ